MSTFIRIFAQGLKIVHTLSHLSICIEQVIAYFITSRSL